VTTPSMVSAMVAAGSVTVGVSRSCCKAEAGGGI
jgi:hypothetical protein